MKRMGKGGDMPQPERPHVMLRHIMSNSIPQSYLRPVSHPQATPHTIRSILCQQEFRWLFEQFECPYLNVNNMVVDEGTRKMIIHFAQLVGGVAESVVFEQTERPFFNLNNVVVDDEARQRIIHFAQLSGGVVGLVQSLLRAEPEQSDRVARENPDGGQREAAFKSE